MGLIICPPPGKSGPEIIFNNPELLIALFFISSKIPLQISVRLWGGISVDNPTAIPDAPFRRHKGNLAGNSSGSIKEPS